METFSNYKAFSKFVYENDRYHAVYLLTTEVGMEGFVPHPYYSELYYISVYTASPWFDIRSPQISFKGRWDREG